MEKSPPLRFCKFEVPSPLCIHNSWDLSICHPNLRICRYLDLQPTRDWIFIIFSITKTLIPQTQNSSLKLFVMKLSNTVEVRVQFLGKTSKAKVGQAPSFACLCSHVSSRGVEVECEMHYCENFYVASNINILHSW